MNNSVDKPITQNQTTEQSEIPSLCLDCQLAPQVNRHPCLPILSMLQVGKNLGVHVSTITFGVTSCKHIIPVQSGGSN